MPKTRIPSPARSQGVPTTPRRYNPRGSRSVGSPARSNTSCRLTTVIQNYKENIESFVLSPLPSRRSLLSDTTDIGEPRRKSWWKKLNENSRDVMEALVDNDAVVANVVEELDVEILSQEQKNYTLDLPDSSDSESISSIVIPQRKLFTNKDTLLVQPQNKYGQLIGRRESMAKLQKTNIENEKTINPGPKKLFGQDTKLRRKPIFPADLLKISPDKTANKTKDILPAEVQGPTRSLFGNRPAVKRKNMFTDFIVSESEDEIPEIQPRVFGFQKKAKQDEGKMSAVCVSSASHGPRVSSPTNSITRLLDISGDWKLLPSSTMVQEMEADDDSGDNLGILAYSDDEPLDNTIEENINAQNNSSVLQDLNDNTASKKRESEKRRNSNDIEKKNRTVTNKSRNESNLVKNNSNNILKQNHILTEEKENVVKANGSVQNASNENSNKNQKLETKSVQQEILNVSMEYEELVNEHQRRLSTRNRSNCGEVTETNNLLVKETDKAKNISNKTQNVSHEIENKLQNKENGNQEAELENENINQNIINENNEIRDEIQEVENKEQNAEVDKDNLKLDADIDQPEEEYPNMQNVSLDTQEERNDDEQGTDDHKKIINESDEIHDENQEVDNEEQNAEDDEEDNNVDNDMEQLVDENPDIKNVSQDIQEERIDDEQETDNQDKIINESDEIHDENQEVENEEQNGEDDEEDNNVDKDMEELVDENPDIKDVSQESQENQDIQDQETDGQELINESDEVHDENQEVENEEHEKEGLEFDEDMEEQEDENTDIQNVSQKSQEEQDIQATDDQGVGNESDEENQEVENEQQDEDDNEEDSNHNEDIEESENETPDIHNVSQESQEDQDNQKQETDDQDDEIDEQDDNQSIENESQENINESEEALIKSNENVGDNETDEVNQTGQDTLDHTHDTTGRNRKKDRSIVKSPEAILHDVPNQINSFTAQGRNTSVRKTKSMIKNLNIRPSLAPLRESTGLSDGTKNSSAEGSCWDSHRVTKKTLRQTFGKDFTPRKSLRALVMEKSAKRHTGFNDVNMDTIDMPRANSTEYPDASNRYDDIENEENDHEISKKMRQTTLEMYLQKIKKENMDKRKKMEEAIRNSLKAPASDTVHLFKMPARPNFVKRTNKKTAQNKPKTKETKSVIPLELPAELLEDMKYKPPKRFKPSNVGWITKRLYKYFETKLEPMYDYKARIRAEILVETIYNFTKDIRRHHVAPASSVEVLKHEMARLGIVKTHHEFYGFIHEFMPREVRVKVVPDIVNKIPLPRLGPFSDILRDVQG